LKRLIKSEQEPKGTNTIATYKIASKAQSSKLKIITYITNNISLVTLVVY